MGVSAATIAQTAAALPETFSQEREATIQQLLDAMEKQEGTMKELLVEFRISFAAGHEASDSIKLMLDTVRSLKVPEPRPPGTKPRTALQRHRIHRGRWGNVGDA